MNTKVGSQFCQCLDAPYRCQGHLGLESGCVIPSRPFHALAPLLAMTFMASVEQGYHLSGCPNNRGHLFIYVAMFRRIASPLKYNYHICGVFKIDILRIIHNNMTSAPSTDRYFFLQIVMADWKFGYVDEPLYMRSIAKSSVSDRCPNEEFSKKVDRVANKPFNYSPVVGNQPGNRGSAVQLQLRRNIKLKPQRILS